MKFEVNEEVVVINGVWTGHTGIIEYYANDWYVVRFADHGKAAVTEYFTADQLQAIGTLTPAEIEEYIGKAEASKSPNKEQLKKRKVLRGEIEECEFNFRPDKIISKKDGTLCLRKGFFYTHGKDAEWTKLASDWGQKIIDALGNRIRLISCEEHWNEWPKDSYWEAIVEVLTY